MAWEKSDKTEDDMINIFCQIDNATKIPNKYRKEILQHLNEILKTDFEFQKIFTFEGVQFGFIPNLDSISGEEFIDIDEFSKDANNWHKVLSVLYRPVIKRKRNWFKKNSHDLYDIMPYDGSKWSETMLNVSCIYYLGAMVFFYNLGNDLLNYMKDYSTALENKMQKKHSLIKSGAGTLA